MIDRDPCQDNQENERLLALERENARLQRLVAELLMKNQMLRDILCRMEMAPESTSVLEFNHLIFKDTV